MKRLSPTAALLLAGCLGTTEATVRNTLDFDFNVHGADHIAGVADVLESEVGAVGLVGDLRPLPAPLPTTRNAIYLSGTNVSGDLFLFQKKRWSGLPGNRTFTVSIQTEFVTNYHSGCTTGPGPAAFIKLGATLTEPLPAVDAQGVLRMNINKGAGINPGDFLQFGDIRNAEADCPSPGTYSPRLTSVMTQPTQMVTDVDGGFWTFIGIQSSFIGHQEIWFTAMRLIVE